MFGTWRPKRPSHSTVVSYLALFVALGGTTAYAANTIGSRDVIDGSLRSRDIKNGNVKSADIGRDQVTTSKLKAGNVGSTDLANSAIVTGKILDGNVLTEDLADGAVNSAKVTDNALTTTDIAGADVNGGKIFVTAGLVPNGRCKQLEANISGAKAGEAVVFSVQAPLQEGVVVYGQRVPSDDHVMFDVCNFSGATQTEIVDLPVRVITFG
jgi:hypothetical protein